MEQLAAHLERVPEDAAHVAQHIHARPPTHLLQAWLHPTHGQQVECQRDLDESTKKCRKLKACKCRNLPTRIRGQGAQSCSVGFLHALLVIASWCACPCLMCWRSQGPLHRLPLHTPSPPTHLNLISITRGKLGTLCMTPNRSKLETLCMTANRSKPQTLCVTANRSKLETLCINADRSKLETLSMTANMLISAPNKPAAATISQASAARQHMLQPTGYFPHSYQMQTCACQLAMPILRSLPGQAQHIV